MSEDRRVMSGGGLPCGHALERLGYACTECRDAELSALRQRVEEVTRERDEARQSAAHFGETAKDMRSHFLEERDGVNDVVSREVIACMSAAYLTTGNAPLETTKHDADAALGAIKKLRLRALAAEATVKELAAVAREYRALGDDYGSEHARAVTAALDAALAAVARRDDDMTPLELAKERERAASCQHARIRGGHNAVTAWDVCEDCAAWRDVPPHGPPDEWRSAK